MTDKYKHIIEITVAAILVSVGGFFGVQQFVYSRTEASKLETRVGNLEERIDHKLERIEDSLNAIRESIKK